MDSSSDKEDVLVIDSSEEDGKVIEISSPICVQGSPELARKCESQSTPLRNNHPKWKRKFQGDGNWTSPNRKDTRPNSDLESSLNSNGTDDHSAPSLNSLEEHTYAKKVLSSPTDSFSLKEALSSDEKKDLEKLQLNLSALCTVFYSLQTKEIVSISIDKFNNLEESLKSSSLKPAQLRSNNLFPRQKGTRGRPRKILNSPNLILKVSETNGTEGKTEVPFSSLAKPNGCVCFNPCICSKVFECRNVESPIVCKPEPVVTSTSTLDCSASTLTVPKKRGRKPKAQEPSVGNTSGPKQEVLTHCRRISSTAQEVSSSSPSGVHQCPPDCKYGKDLLVFAKWPADKIYYPAIVHGCFYTDWEYSDNLNVQFFDGASIKMSSCNIFPASLVVKGSSITYKNNEDEYIDGIVKQVERTHKSHSLKSSTCLSFLIECVEEEDGDFGQIRSVPFTSVALNDHCYRDLKKEIGESVLTPHKFSRTTYNVCHDNLIEGKRTRRGAEEAVALILSEESDKKHQSAFDENIDKPRRGRKKKVKELKAKQNGPEEKVAVRRKRKLGARSSSPNEDSFDENQVEMSADRSCEPKLKRKQPNKTTHGIKEKKSKLDYREIPSTSATKRPTAPREVFFRNDVVSADEHSDSEPDDYEPDFDVSIIGGGDIDYECTTYIQTSRKSSGNRNIKSALKKPNSVADEDEILTSRYGPMPESPLFVGYSFVLTHGGESSFYKNEIPRKELKHLCDKSEPPCEDSEQPCEESEQPCEDSEQPCEESEQVGKESEHPCGEESKQPCDSNQLNEESNMSAESDTHQGSYSFNHLRLKNQITAGKGLVFKHLLSVPKDSLEKTLVISDFPCRTANYLLAAALNVPVYSHQLIIECCLGNVPLEKMRNPKQLLPVGITSDQVSYKFSKKRRGQIMKSYTVVLSSTEANHRLRFWTKIIRLLGGKVSYYTPKRNVLGAIMSMASVIIVDDHCTSYLIDSAKKNNIPVVSTQWLVDTVIRGHKQTMSTDLPQYRVHLMSSPSSSFSLAQ